ncbi:hypothetical protein B0H14DRAFT_3429610 [Mycena olivaceomarginata]|nr:hypothetical protein B0H14DRAFT_3429610 [Mycena olivaceomarginata]
MLEQGGYALQAGRRRGPQRGRPVTRMPSTRRPVSQQSENDSDDFVDPVLCAVEALDGASETTTETEFSEDADDTASIADGHNGGPVVIDDGTLTRGERKATRLRISQIFRQVCNVYGKEWPAVSELRVNPITKRQYPTPNFNSDVLHPDNCALFRKVGLRAQVVLSDTAAWPNALKRLKTLKDPIVWDLDFTTECAKKSFRSYKKQWQAQATIEGREKAEEKEKRDRRTQRRKSEQIKKISDAVAEENDMDAMFICDSTHPEYLSDEMAGTVSGYQKLLVLGFGNVVEGTETSVFPEWDVREVTLREYRLLCLVAEVYVDWLASLAGFEPRRAAKRDRPGLSGP